MTIFSIDSRFVGFVTLIMLLSTGCASGDAGDVDPVSATPTASISMSRSSVESGTKITLNGKESSDPAGKELTYMWSLNTPTESSAQLNSTSGPTATFTADVVGTYRVELIVSNGSEQSEPASTMIEMVEGTTSNQAPSADAGKNQTVQVGQPVTVDGSASSDPDADELEFNWSFAQKPSTSALSTADLDNSSATQKFTPEVAGDFVLELEISDGNASDIDTVTVTAENTSDNTAPGAEAGEDQSVAVGAEVVLDGSDSSDADGDSLQFTWALTQTPSNSTAQLTNPETSSPSFNADVAGRYVAELTVSDGTAEAKDTVEITAAEENTNTAPTATAEANPNAVVGTQVKLDASGSSDAEDSADELSYTWMLTQDPSNGSGSISKPNQAKASFTPSTPGTYGFELTVKDTDGASATASLEISVDAQNTPPTAVVGSSRSVEIGDTATLDGTNSSDPEDSTDQLSFSWSLTQQPATSNVTLENPNTTEPKLTPSVQGTYTAELTVTDTASATDSATIDIEAVTGNTAPVADAGSDEKTNIGEGVNLSAFSSSDSEDSFSSLSFSWAIISGPSGGGSDTLKYADTSLPELVPSVAGDYVVELTVTDTEGASSTDTVTVSVNHSPEANAGGDQTVNVGMTVQLDASSTSDKEDDIDQLAVEWNFLSDPSNGSDSLSDDTSVSPTFTPTVAGTYELELVVLDSSAAQDTDTITITVNEDLMPSSEGDVIVTEIMKDPETVGDFDGGEWFEVYNTTGDPVDLEDCRFSDLGTNDFRVQNSLEIDSGSYATLADSDSPGFTPDYNYDGGMVLYDGDDEIILTCDGTEIDRVEWDDGNTFPDPSGASMELSENWYDYLSNDDGSYWSEASAVYNGDKGTPGSGPVSPNSDPIADAGSGQSVDVGKSVTLDGTGSSDPEDSYSKLSFSWSFNQDPSNGSDSLNNASTDQPDFTPSAAGTYEVEVTVTDTDGASSTDTVQIEVVGTPSAEGDVIITEIMKNPKTVEDNDGGEWFEVYNTSGSTVDLDGCKVADADVDSFTIQGELTADAGGYITFADSGSPGFTPDYNYDGNMALANGDDELILSCDGTEIDRVEYDGGSTFPDPTGASLDLQDSSYDATANDDGSNWSEATDDYNGDSGTPGS